MPVVATLVADSMLCSDKLYFEQSPESATEVATTASNCDLIFCILINFYKNLIKQINYTTFALIKRKYVNILKNYPILNSLNYKKIENGN